MVQCRININAYVANSPSIQGLVEALGKSLPATGAKIIGVALPEPQQPDPKLAKTSAPLLEQKTAELETLVVRVSRLVAAVNAKPSDDRFKLCQVDARLTGLSMRLLPAGDLSVPAGGAASIVVAGGVLPYRADWVGARPPADQVEKKVESGQGVITIEIKPGAKSASYQLLVLDAGQGREVIRIGIVEGEAKADPVVKTGLTVPKPTPVEDPFVKKVQLALIAKGFATVKVDNKYQTLVADGVVGKITTASMTSFYKSQGTDVTDDMVPKGDKLLKEVSSLLAVESEAAKK